MIVLDPGHGGDDRGTCAGPETIIGEIRIPRLEEALITLQICKKVADALWSLGYNTVLTRAEDQTTSFTTRANIIRDAAFFVSVHVNSSPNPTTRGPEAYYARDGLGGFHGAFTFVESVPVYIRVGKRKRVFLASEAAKPLELGGRDTPGPESVLRRYHMTDGFLAELAYTSNEQDIEILLNPHHQNTLAVALVQGILVGLQHVRK
jgi:N-acetylmuramoyl-L-alanine amidase